MKKITAYQTSDGTLFDGEYKAALHEAHGALQELGFDEQNRNRLINSAGKLVTVLNLVLEALAPGAAKSDLPHD